MAEIAKRWGYDIDKRMFIVQLRDDVPNAIYTVEVSTDSGRSMSKGVAVMAGSEVAVPIEAQEGEGVRARFLSNGEEVDSVWVRVAKVTCPHCGKRIDRDDPPSLPTFTNHRDTYGNPLMSDEVAE